LTKTHNYDTHTFEVSVMGSSVRTTIVLPEEKLKGLKLLAFERGSSIGKLINEAIDRTFFKKKGRTSFSSLRGIWKKARLSEKDIARARIKAKAFPS
jgi:hypothetical protein